jgi:broad specificity phosphatase PhoE
MTRLALIRHAATEWTEQGRIQGRTDMPLSPRGRDAAAGRRSPAIRSGAEWFASPLARARETAQLMFPGAVAIEPRLIEMDWGRWEGRRLESLRAEFGSEMAENEAKGLDFRPDGGESPRDVQARLTPWLAEVAAGDRMVKGVIRAMLALATGWDMTGSPPVRLAWDCAHLLTLAPDGAPAIDRANIPFKDP